MITPALFLATAAASEAAPQAGAWTLGVLGVGVACAVLVVALRGRLFNAEALAARVEAAGRMRPAHWLLLAFAGWWTWAVIGSVLAGAVSAETVAAHPLLSIAMALAAYGTGLLTMVGIGWAWRADIRLAGLRASPTDPIAAGVGCFFGFPMVLALSVLSLMAATAIARATGGAPPDAIAHDSLRELLQPRDGVSPAWRIAALAIQAVVLAPIFEEAVYRLCLQSSLVSATRRTWPAILVASAVFAIVHAAAVPLHAMPVLFGVGVLCGVLFERTGRLGPPILAHAAFNALNLAMALQGAGGSPEI